MSTPSASRRAIPAPPLGYFKNNAPPYALQVAPLPRSVRRLLGRRSRLQSGHRPAPKLSDMRLTVADASAITALRCLKASAPKTRSGTQTAARHQPPDQPKALNDLGHPQSDAHPPSSSRPCRPSAPRRSTTRRGAPERPAARRAAPAVPDHLADRRRAPRTPGPIRQHLPPHPVPARGEPGRAVARAGEGQRSGPASRHRTGQAPDGGLSAPGGISPAAAAAGRGQRRAAGGQVGVTSYRNG